jgi:hypothetical protein
MRTKPQLTEDLTRKLTSAYYCALSLAEDLKRIDDWPAANRVANYAETLSEMLCDLELI